MTTLPDVVASADAMLPAVPAAPARSPFHAYLDSLTSEESKRTMRSCLNRIARLVAEVDDEQWGQLTHQEQDEFGATLSWGQLTYAHTSRIRTILTEQGWSPSHVNKHLVALRRVLKEAWRLGLMTAEERDRATDLPPMKGTRLPAGTHVPAESLGAVLTVCGEDARSDNPGEALAGARDGAMLSTLYSTGCRRAELTGLEVKDYDPRSRALRVRGKGDKERLVYLHPDAMSYMEAWLAVRGRQPGALFPPLKKGGTIRLDKAGRPAHMTPRAVGTIVDARFAQAATARRTPHDFRRTFVGELLDAGVDLATVQGLTGHASPATTARYDRRPERRRREATDKLTFPKPASRREH